MTGVMGLLSWVGLAVAGEVFFVDHGTSEVVEFDVRSLSSTVITTAGFVTDLSGVAYDEARDTLWITSDGPYQSLRPIVLSTGVRRNFGQPHTGPTELSYDPVQDQLIGVSQFGIYEFPSFSLIASPGIRLAGADWFDDGGYTIAHV